MKIWKVDLFDAWHVFFVARVRFLISCSINVKLLQFPRHSGFAFGRWAQQHVDALRSIDLNAYTWPPTYLRDFLVNGITARNWYALHAMPKEFYVGGESAMRERVTYSLYIHMSLLTCQILFTDWCSFFIHVIPGMLDFILREESHPTGEREILYYFYNMLL